MTTDRSRLIRLAASLPKGSKKRKTLLAKLKTAGSLSGPFAWVDKRTVSFWVFYPLKFGQDGTASVMTAIKQADGMLASSAKRAMANRSPQARSIASSVQMGHLVATAPTGKGLHIYTEFWKEGSDRNRAELEEMEDHLQGAGFQLKPFVLR